MSLLDVAGFTTIKLRKDDDMYDRASHRFSVIFIAVCFVIVSGKYMVSDKIRCFCPAEFKSPWCQYTNEYCWVSEGAVIPPATSPHKLDFSMPIWSVSYHTWVLLYLLVQALFFVLPTLVWRLCCDSTSFHVDMVVRLLADDKAVNPANRETTMKYIVEHTDRYLSLRSATYGTSLLGHCHQRLGGGGRRRRWGRPSPSLFSVYMLVKLLFLANALGQFYLMGLILDPPTASNSLSPRASAQGWSSPDGGRSEESPPSELIPYSRWGLYVAREFAVNHTYTENWVMFPREIMCTVNWKRMGQNNHRNSIQCVLPLNAFNERVYLVMWFWLVSVAAVTSAGILSWCFVHLACARVKYVKKTLKKLHLRDRLDGFGRPGGGAYGMDPEKLSSLEGGGDLLDSTRVRSFVEEYLGADGVFFLRLLARNVSDLEMAEFVGKLWEFYLEKTAVPFTPTTETDAAEKQRWRNGNAGGQPKQQGRKGGNRKGGGGLYPTAPPAELTPRGPYGKGMDLIGGYGGGYRLPETNC